MSDDCSRNVYKGTQDELLQVLMPYAVTGGPSFCKYDDESKNCSDAKLKHGAKGVEGHIAILTSLQKLHNNLSFPKVALVATLGTLLSSMETDSGTWTMSDDEKADWCETVARRLRNMCRCVGQGELKSKNSQWVKNLPWHAVSPEKVAAVTSVKYEFDAELLLPVKQLANGTKEPGLPIDLGECKKLGKVVANWPDGHTATIDTMTVDDLVQILSVSKAGKGPGDLWASTHTGTHNIVTIKQKVDRSLLIVIYDQKKQVCMVKANLFGTVEDERHQLPDSHPAVKAGLEFLTTIAVKYCEGKLEKSQLGDERNKMLDASGLGGNLRKRPAAAPQYASEKTKKAKKEGTTVKKEATSVKKEAEAKEEEDAEGGRPGDDEGDAEEEPEEEQQEEDEESEENPEELEQPGEDEADKTPVAMKRPSAASGSTGLPSDWSMSMPKVNTDAMVNKFFTM
jgi:hypothetical protein